MIIDEIKIYMSQGREIEFSVNKKVYFMQPDYNGGEYAENSDVLYIIYDCENKAIFMGKFAEVVNYKFENIFTLENDSDKFVLRYIY